MRKNLFIFLILFLGLSSFWLYFGVSSASGDRYWVGNGGNWSDTTHWSLTSGGPSGASVPDINTNCHFDASSFSLAAQIVVLNQDGACSDMSWTGVTNSPTFTMSNLLTIGGSFTLANSMTVNGSSTGMVFDSANTNSITLATHSLPLINVEMIFQGGGVWNIQDDWSMSSLQVFLKEGILNTNDHDIHVRQIYDGQAHGVPSGVVVLDLGSSDVTINDALQFILTDSTVIGDESNIILIPDVDFVNFFMKNNEFASVYGQAGTNTGEAWQLSGIIYAHTLTLDPDVNFSLGNIKTDNLVSNGSAGHLVYISGDIQSTEQISVDYMDITNSICALVTPCYAGTHSHDGGGNSNWVFTVPPPPAISSVTGENPGASSTTPSITINGTGFTPSSTVTVGGTSAVSVTYVSSIELSVVAPSKTTGLYNVVVTNPDTSSDTCVNCMEYFVPTAPYWYKTGVDAQWTTLAGNWWSDINHTQQASSLPMSLTDVVTLGSVAPIVNLDTWVAPASIDATNTGISFTSQADNALNMDVLGDATFYGSSSLDSSTITGNVIFNDQSYNEGSVSGDATFVGIDSYNSGSVGGDAIFYSGNNGVITISNNNQWAGGSVSGSILGVDNIPITSWIFNNSSQNRNTINGNVTFNDSSINNGDIVGNVIFNDSSSHSGDITGDATFYDQSFNDDTINGNATFYEDRSENNDTVTGSLTRKYTNSISISRDFISSGPWIVVADGARVKVNIKNAIYDADTVFVTMNGGSFVSSSSGTSGTKDKKSKNEKKEDKEDKEDNEINCSVTMGLKFGYRGKQVKCLQQILKVTDDGIFGPKTQSAVNSFQKVKGILVDGVVGPKTRSFLNILKVF